MSFDRLRAANIARQVEWPGDHMCDMTFRALEVCGEAGEVAEAVKKLACRERGIAGSTATIADVADEIADVVITLDLLAEHPGIDIWKSVIAKFNKTSVKYEMATRLSGR